MQGGAISVEVVRLPLRHSHLCTTSINPGAKYFYSAWLL